MHPARAVEKFLDSLLTRAGQYAASRNAKTLSVGHLYGLCELFCDLTIESTVLSCRKHCIVNEKQWDFLKELTVKIPDLCADADNVDASTHSKRGRQAIRIYYLDDTCQSIIFLLITVNSITDFALLK